MSACDNFVEQLWRKGKCANCFQSRERHQNGDIKTQDDASFAGRTANCKPRRALIHPQSQSNQNAKTANVEKTANLYKEEKRKEENDRGGANGIKTIAPCKAHATNDNTKGRTDGTTSDAGKMEQDSKSFVVNKPKPLPRPKPRPPSRAVEFGNSVISRDESPQESSDPLNGSIPHENSLGKSHNRPQCNAKSLEKSELVLSIPDHDIKEPEEAYNKQNIEAVCETIVDEEAIMDIEDSIDMDSVDRDDNGKISSKNASIDDSFVQSEIDLSDLKIVDDDDSDVDGYVPMKSNIALFTAEPIPLHNFHKTDVLEPNSEVRLELHENAVNDNRTVHVASTCYSEVDEESEKTSGVLEFRNPLCLITNEMGSGDSNSTVEEPTDACDKLNSNKITSKSASAEPFYVNRPASTSSSDTGSSSHDSGYENTRKSTRSNSTNSASGNSNDIAVNVITEGEASLADMPAAFAETNRDCRIETSETSSSSWGSSTWDSCSASDFQENSCEGLFVEKATGKCDARSKVDKPHSEVLTIQAKNGQSVALNKGNDIGSHVYVNTTLKPFTKPYKVVDISTGVSVPTAESQHDVPPLPPKEKDLKKDKEDEFKNHVYLEPTEEVPSIPEQGPPDEKKEAVPAPKETTCSSPQPNPTTNSIGTTDNSVAVRRVPAPRPRSRVPSQFGTLPKPAPRMSRNLNDAPKLESKEVKEQKVTTAQPAGKYWKLT